MKLTTQLSRQTTNTLKLFFEAILIYIELDIRRVDIKSIIIAHKNNKNNVLVILDPEL